VSDPVTLEAGSPAGLDDLAEAWMRCGWKLASPCILARPSGVFTVDTDLRCEAGVIYYVCMAPPEES
jgi:hypothetical protein